ncbi:hypothetical protein ABK040_004788 [Willaertia magna]
MKANFSEDATSNSATVCKTSELEHAKHRRMRKLTNNNDFNNNYFELRVYKNKKKSKKKLDFNELGIKSSSMDMPKSCETNNNLENDKCAFNVSPTTHVMASAKGGHIHTEDYTFVNPSTCEPIEQRLSTTTKNMYYMTEHESTKNLEKKDDENNLLFEQISLQFNWLMNNNTFYKLPLKQINFEEIQQEWNDIVDKKIREQKLQ